MIKPMRRRAEWHRYERCDDIVPMAISGSSSESFWFLLVSAPFFFALLLLCFSVFRTCVG